MLFAATAGAWLAYRTIRMTTGIKRKAFFSAMGVIIMAISALGAVKLTDRGPVDWVYYTPERFSEESEKNKVIVLVFTAEWCLNCKALEQGVFRDPAIADLLAREEIVPMKVDITGNNPAGKAKLKEAGTLTIPLLVIYSPKGKQLFKSDFYTTDQVREAITTVLTNTGSSS